MHAQFAVSVLAMCAAGALAAPPPVRYGPTPAPARYQFEYAVSDEYAALEYGQTESRDGAETSGSYHVLLPDGRVQRVQYSVVGDQGFQAEVSYEGEARPYRPAPVYGPHGAGGRARTYTLQAPTEAPLPATPEAPAVETVEDAVEQPEPTERTESTAEAAKSPADVTPVIIYRQDTLQ